jgi:hypothetical protein
VHHFRTTLVLALFWALMAGFSPALAQGGSDDETIVIHQMDVRSTSIDLGGYQPTIVIDYDIEDVSEDDPGLEDLFVHLFDDEGELVEFDFRVVSATQWFRDIPLRATGTLQFEVPALLPPGEYDLAVSLYRSDRRKVIDKQLGIATPGTVTLYRGGDGPWNTPPSISNIYETMGSTDVTDGDSSLGYYVEMFDYNRTGLASLTIELFKDGVSTGSRVSHDLPDDMTPTAGPPPGGYVQTSIGLPQTLSHGPHEIKFTLTDNSGLSSTGARTIDIINRSNEGIPPIIESVSFEEESIDLGEKYFPPPFRVIYEYSDVGSGVSKVEYTLVNQEDPSDRQTLTIAFDAPTPSVSGSHSLTHKFNLSAVRYTLSARLFDGAGNETYEENLDSIEITSDDTRNPYVYSLTLTPNQIETSPVATPASLSYSLGDAGDGGLRELRLSLRDVNDASRTYAVDTLRFTRESRVDSQSQISLPASLPTGEYFLRYELKDAAGNIATGTVSERLTVTEGSVGPVFTALSLSAGTLHTDDPSGELVVSYALTDGDERGLRWLKLALESETGDRVQSDTIDLLGAPSADGTYSFSLSDFIGRPGRYQLIATAADTDAYEATSLTQLPSTPERVEILEPNQRRFGPYSWAGVGTEDHPYRDIYRLSGLHHGAPASIQLMSVEDTGNTLSSCSVDVRDDRYNGSEYLILSQDIPQTCSNMGLTQLRFLISFPAQQDPDSVTLSRFKISPTGRLTDMAADRVTTAYDFQQRQALQLELGPFEWVESGQDRQHLIAFSTVSGMQQIDVAIRNASRPGFSGTYSDCSFSRSPAEAEESHYLLTSQMLAACGEIGRADLNFRLSASTAWIDEFTSAARLISTAGGSISDFAPDYTPSLQPELTALSGGVTLAVYPPFEWTGDANAPTSNLFRFAGLEGGAPVEIVLRALQDEDWTDCELPISDENAGAFDYIVTPQDLAECGTFGRANLQFRVTYVTNAQGDEAPTLRRLAIGAHGDLTDFGFDLDDRAATPPTPIANDMAEIEFGPFEWTGDHTVSTQNVFRISGLSGAPDSVDIALMNATQDGFAGDFSDCSLFIRAHRAGENEFVIASNDLVDCGGFLRADIRFRVRANADQFADEVRMRRFAVTRDGGLTDFGFDNHP